MRRYASSGSYNEGYGMAKIGGRRVGELMLGVMRILLGHPETGLAAKQVLEQLAAFVPPTSFESTSYEGRPAVRRYEKIVRFASIDMVKAGWLAKEKGIWSITDDGVRTFEKYNNDPDGLRADAMRLYQQW